MSFAGLQVSKKHMMNLTLVVIYRLREIPWGVKTGKASDKVLELPKFYIEIPIDRVTI